MLVQKGILVQNFSCTQILFCTRFILCIVLYHVSQGAGHPSRANIYVVNIYVVNMYVVKYICSKVSYVHSAGHPSRAHSFFFPTYQVFFPTSRFFFKKKGQKLGTWRTGHTSGMLVLVGLFCLIIGLFCLIICHELGALAFVNVIGLFSVSGCPTY